VTQSGFPSELTSRAFCPIILGALKEKSLPRVQDRSRFWLCDAEFGRLFSLQIPKNDRDGFFVPRGVKQVWFSISVEVA
jgi:hypothetical protein